MTTAIIAIDRAEKQLGAATKKFTKEHNNIKTYMLVNSAFKNSSAYRGDETEGLFEEIVCDFDDTQALKSILDRITEDTTIFHCRMEEAIKDYQKVLATNNYPFTQSIESLTWSTEKHEMRKKISTKYPELNPKFIEIRSLDNFDELVVRDFSWPVIIKPNGLHSSFLVKKCFNLSDLKDSLKNAFNELEAVYEREYGTGKPSILLEEFIEGDMYSIDGYAKDGSEVILLPPIRVVTAAELGLDGYYSYAHYTKTDLSSEDVSSANNCVSKAIDALELRYSSFHAELYKTKKGWKIIEIAPRIGGYRQELYYEAYGIDHYYNDLLLHHGEDPDTHALWKRFANGFNIYADFEGTIGSIKGIEAARKLDSSVFVNVHFSESDRAVFASNGGQFIVDGILSSDSPEALARDLEKIRELIIIEPDT